ncbi:MAG TPA: hypothetical protein VHX65_15695 [Pirellulales bacterium]|nr:hypothetical protein [Pirellulales bacterium]
MANSASARRSPPTAMRGTVLWAATRKGLFRLEPEGSNGQPWRIVRVSFVGQPVTMLLSDRRDGAIYAALNLGHFGVKLHRSDDDGDTWTEVAAPVYPQSNGSTTPVKAAVELPDHESPSESGTAPDAGSDTAATSAPNAAAAGPAVKQIWSLEAAGPEAADGLWCGTLPGGLFHSSDRGASWTLNASLWEQPERKNWMGGGYDVPGIHSICVDPRDPRHVLVGVSCGGVWRTRDSGSTWSQTAHGMIADYMPPQRREDPQIQDPHRMVQCAADPEVLWVQHHNGVFKSTNGAARWERIETIRPSGFGFGVAVHPRDSQTAWFVPAIKDELRVPVDGRLVVARTRDGGHTCEMFSTGLPQEHCYDLIYRHALEICPDGNQLAIGSTTGNLWTSSDAGETWAQVPNHLPPIYALRF